MNRCRRSNLSGTPAPAVGVSNCAPAKRLRGASGAPQSLLLPRPARSGEVARRSRDGWDTLQDSEYFLNLQRSNPLRPFWPAPLEPKGSLGAYEFSEDFCKKTVHSAGRTESSAPTGYGNRSKTFCRGRRLCRPPWAVPNLPEIPVKSSASRWVDVGIDPYNARSKSSTLNKGEPFSHPHINLIVSAMKICAI